MISHRYQCIFVHIPKTAGSSISDAIWPEPSLRTRADLWGHHLNNPHQTGGLQHLRAVHIRQEVGDAFAKYWKFSFVRNPWDRVISQYLFTMRERSDLRDLLTLPEDASLDLYLSRIPEKEHVQWMPQRRFLYDGETLLVDFVGRYERLEEDAAKVFARLGTTNSLPRTNMAPQRLPYRDYYDSRTRRVVEALYAEDIATFGYTF